MSATRQRVCAASLAFVTWGGVILYAQPASRTTVLYEDRAISIESDRRNDPDLWIRRNELARVNGFEVKPQGACRADICIPISKQMLRGAWFNLSGFARKAGEAVVADSGVWSLGEIPELRGAFLKSRQAPDFAVPDRKGTLVHLSDFRGKKVLLVTWASW